jgi:UDP-glucose 4-epimerase
LKILITGISGFLGRNLISKLSEYELYGLDIQKEVLDGVKVFGSDNIEDIEINFDVVIICHAAVASGTTVLSNKILFDVNVSLTEKIVNKFNDAFIVYISTASIYDINLDIVYEKSIINPQSQYAISKYWGEKVVLNNKKSTIIRLSSLYGIGMKENTLISNYINQALQNKVIQVWGKGERVQNYIHVSDVAKVIHLIIQNQQKFCGKLLLGVSKKEYSNLQIAQIIAKLTQSEIQFVNDDYSKSFCYNNNYTTNLLNWEIDTSIEERLQNYIEWKQKK